MEIGAPIREFTIEPFEDPVPHEREAPVPEREPAPVLPERERELIPA